MDKKVLELNKCDYEFLEAMIEIKDDIINGVLKFIVENKKDSDLVQYLEAWANRDNEHMDLSNVDEVEEKIDVIKALARGEN